MKRRADYSLKALRLLTVITMMFAAGCASPEIDESTEPTSNTADGVHNMDGTPESNGGPGDPGTGDIEPPISGEPTDSSGDREPVVPPPMDENDPVREDGDDTRDEDTPNQECQLEGTAAVKILAQVSWPGSLAMEPGEGTFEIWFKSEINDDGEVIIASGHVCEVDVPDFHTKPLAGGDTHGTVIPADAWLSGPRTALSLRLSGRAPGSILTVDPTAMFLGTELSEPMGSWPTSSSNMRAIDHDNDGYPGVTSYAAMGAGYSNPRIAAFNPSLRANRIFLGMRNIIGFEGMLTSCGRAEGTANLSLDQRSFGCLTPEGDECNPSQTALLDGNMPQFQVEEASFTLQTLSDDTDCAAIRRALP